MIHPGERYRDKFERTITVEHVDMTAEVITAWRDGSVQQLPFTWWERNVEGRES